MCGLTSRRKAEELILSGKVELNGKVITTLATRVNPHTDRVFVNGKQIVQSHDYLYLVMNKPKDTITTLSDERGRATVTRLLHTKARVFPIGRLDRNTTGVLLFTNDGEFAHMLMHPKFEIPKAYQVWCDKVVQRHHIEELRKGVKLDDGTTAPAEVQVIPGSKGKQLGIVLREGRNRQIHRMLEALGYEVQKLDRVAYGPISREGLPRGATRSLTKSEVRELKRLAGGGE